GVPKSHRLALCVTAALGMARHTQGARMIEGLRRILRTRGYSPRTEESYLHWTADFWRFHKDPHWRDVTGKHGELYLDHLANDRRLAPKTRNLAGTSLVWCLRSVSAIRAPTHPAQRRCSSSQ
ncbi:MAG: site-specific integrase, partial [Gemmatimonadetes bacterium]|nr:site-specific integrase [Gemmatimonadota bacterium]